MKETYIAFTLSFKSETVGSDAFNFVNASSKSVGSVTFWSASRLGMLNCGTLMFPNGLTRLKADTVLWMAELAVLTSFWIEVRIPFIVLCTTLLIWQRIRSYFHELIYPRTYLLHSTNEDSKTTTNYELQETQKSRAININNEIDDRLHYCERQHQSLTSSIHRSVNCICELLVCCNSHEPRHASRSRRGLFGRLAADQKVSSSVSNSILRCCRGQLKPKYDEEQ